MNNLLYDEETLSAADNSVKSFNPSEMLEKEVDDPVKPSHDEYVNKKELEFALSVNNSWAFERMYTYSSFKGAYWSKYHRIIFNIFAICMVLINSYTSRNSSQVHFLIAHTVLILVFTIYIVILRPYRCWSTNTIYIIAMVGLTLKATVLTVSTLQKRSNDSQNEADDRAFFLIVILSISIFVTVIIAFIAIVVISAIIRVRWPVDTSYLRGKEVAIAALADARQFLREEEQKEVFNDRLKEIRRNKIKAK